MRLIALLGVLFVIFGAAGTLMAISRYFFDYVPPRPRMSRVQMFWARLFAAWFWWFMVLSPVGRTGIYLLLHSRPDALYKRRQARRDKRTPR